MADAVGNVYSTGGFPDTTHFGALTLYAHPNPALMFAPPDVFVSKQDAQGDFIWVTQIGGNYGDVGTSVAFSANSNIMVLGTFFDTVQVMTAGGPVTLSGSNNAPYVFVAALRPSTGDILWIKQFGDNNGSIIAQAQYALPVSIALDAEGNIYLEGSLSGTVDFDPGSGSYPLSGVADMVVCKLNPQGDFVWAAKTETFGNSSVTPSAISVDGAGNIYTTGGYEGKIDFDPGTDTFFLNTGQINYHVNNDIFICKWNSGGSFGWVKTLKRSDVALGTTTSNNYATSIFVDELGNVYTTGSLFGYMDMNSDTAAADTLIFSSNATQHMGYIHKLDAEGDFQWAIPIKDKGGHYTSAANAIIKDDSGHLLVTGGFNGTVDFDPNGGTYNLSGGGAFVLKLNDTADNSGVGIGAAGIFNCIPTRRVVNYG
ncbi:MAG TPA: hypothetical protein VFL76_00115 [Edaphocola sp.]|nr:hypothetical protein [Edaphocola sp.]